MGELQPDTLVVVAGTNDITYDTHAGVADPKHIAEKVVNIGRDAPNVSDIHIFGITRRRDNDVKRLIDQTNLEIRLLCEQSGFHFVDTSDIEVRDLDRDGLHLNPGGTKKIMQKILECNSSFNPFLSA